MTRFALGRLAYALTVLLGVATLTFGLLHLAGDPLDGLVPPGATRDDRAALRARYGLDRPLAAQYLTFLARAARGDLGESWGQRQPALAAVLDRLPATLALTGAALGLALLVGVPLGLAASVRPNGPIRAIATAVALLGQALPGFWLGTVLILLFAVRLGWLPASGFDGPRSLVLPAAALAAYPAATITRLLRAAMGEALRRDHVRTARGKGLPGRVVLLRHALPSAALPTLAYVGLQAGFLLGGAVVVEAVFAYPGLGRLGLDAVADRDLPLVQAFVVVVAALIVAVNLLVDLAAASINPRLRAKGSLAAVAGRA